MAVNTIVKLQFSSFIED